MVVYLAAIQALPREYYEYAVLEGAGRFQRFRRITWPLLWPQTFTLVLLTTLGTLRIFDMVWVMTEGGPSHATETVATDVYVDRVPVPPGRLRAGDGDDPAGRDPAARGRGVPDPRSPRRDGELVTGLPRLRLVHRACSAVLAVVWLYPVVWTLTNAIKSSADIYRAPWDVPWPPAIGNIGEAWSRGQLGRRVGELGLCHRDDRGDRPRRCRSAARIRSRGCDRPAEPCSSWWSWRR